MITKNKRVVSSSGPSILPVFQQTELQTKGEHRLDLEMLGLHVGPSTPGAGSLLEPVTCLSVDPASPKQTALSRPSGRGALSPAVTHK